MSIVCMFYFSTKHTCFFLLPCEPTVFQLVASQFLWVFITVKRTALLNCKLQTLLYYFLTLYYYHTYKMSFTRTSKNIIWDFNWFGEMSLEKVYFESITNWSSPILKIIKLITCFIFTLKQILFILSWWGYSYSSLVVVVWAWWEGGGNLLDIVLIFLPNGLYKSILVSTKMRKIQVANTVFRFTNTMGKKSFSFSKTLNKSSPLVTISFPTWRWLDWNPWSTVPDLFYQKHKIRNTCTFIKSCSDYGISLPIYIHSNFTALLEGHFIKLHNKPTNNMCVWDRLKENFYFPSDSLKLL